MNKKGIFTQMSGIGVFALVISAVLGLMVFLMGIPAIVKIWDFAFNTNFRFGDPWLVGVVAVIIFIVLMRRKREVY